MIVPLKGTITENQLIDPAIALLQLLVQVCSKRKHKRRSIYYKIRFNVLVSNKKGMQKIEMMHVSIITRYK
jgi:hypothetical protein